MTQTKTLGYKELRKDPRFTVPLPADGDFFARELDLDRPELAEVRRLAAEGDAAGARDAYLRLIGSDEGGRYYFAFRDVPKLMKAAREAYGGGEEALAVIAEADRIVSGDIPLFKGKRAVFPRGAFDWNGWLYDSSQYQLHLTRFAYTKFLSRAYALTGDEIYAACFNEMIGHFLDDCPAPAGDAFRVQHNTWEPLSAGVRMFHLAEPFAIFFGSPSFAPEVKMKLVKSFAQHARYVRKYHADHGNHACMQLRGLIQVALLLPELREAGEWLAYGLREMPKYIRQNVYPDGVQFEASPNYHLVVMRDLYELVPLLRAAKLEASEYMETLENMFVVLNHLLTPEGELPRIGDTGASDVRELRDAMSLGAYLFERPDFKFAGHARLPFALLWRLGPEAIERYGRLPSAPPSETAACFPVGGYVVSRQSWERGAMYMAMRAGVGINGHAHSDALGLVLYAGGKELVADSGMGLYEWNKERKYVVSTRAHNTVVVDGQDQHVRGLHWGTPPTAACKIWDFRSESRFDYVFASHYGYTRYEDPVIHSRKTLFVKNRYWLVVDLFEAKERHVYEQYFHLPPGEAVFDPTGRRVRTNGPDANALLVYPQPDADPGPKRFAATGASPFIVLSDELILESGLYFEKSGYSANPVVKRAMSAVGKAELATVIVPFGTEAPAVSVRRLPVRADGRELAPWEATGLLVESDGWADAICLYHAHVPADSYLDHTGNPVKASLLPEPDVIGAFEFAGEAWREDVIVKPVR